MRERRERLVAHWNALRGRAKASVRAMLAVLAVLTAAFLPSSGARAAGILFFVNTLDDHDDGACNGTDCSLREAIKAANSAPGNDDGIEFTVTGTITLTSVLPDVSGGVSIDGPGAASLTVRRDDGADGFPIFNVTATSAVRVSGLTIDNGDGTGDALTGAGITNASTGIVNVVACTITNGYALNGGGLANVGTMTVTDSTISDNAGSTSGGGIYNQGTLVVVGSSLTGNQGGGSGGGINNNGMLTISDSTLRENRIGFGGGIYNTGTAIIRRCTLTANTARDDGGAVLNAGSGLVAITNTTIHGNSAMKQGGGISNAGTVTLTNSTMAGNHAGAAYGGIEAGPAASVKNSIIALNTSSSPTNPQDVGGNFTSLGFNLIGNDIASTGFTAATDLTGTAASPLDPRLETDAMGKPLLKANGGATETIALLCDSPALDKATHIGIDGPLPVDQRSFARTVDDPLLDNAPGGSGTDIGALEVQSGCSGGRPVPTPRPSPATLDHFLSYDVRPTKGSEPFVPRGPVTLTDALGEREYEIGKPLALALPAIKNGDGRRDAATHLLQHQVTTDRDAPKFAPQVDVHVLNQCSDVFLAVTKPVSLLVPTAKDLTNPVAPPVEANHEIDHYLCYRAKAQAKLVNGTRLPKAPTRVQVDVEDQFETRRYDLRGITRLCLPTAKSGTPVFAKGDAKGEPAPLTPAAVRHADALLTCYRAKLARVTIPQLGCGPADPANKGIKIDPAQPKHAPRTGIFVANQLGSLRLDSVKERELCVPSVLAP